MNTRIVGLTAFCVVFNCLSGLGVFFAEPFGALNSRQQIQSPVFEFLGDAGMPARVIAAMVRNGAPLGPEYRQNKTDHKTQSDNASSSYGVSQNGARYIAGNPNTGSSGTLGYLRYFVSDASPPRGKFYEHYGGIVIIFLLMYFVLLSRGNLPGRDSQ